MRVHRPRTTSRGIVIALSGIESSGKSTQRELLVDYLRSQGTSPVQIWTRPGYSPRLKIIKRLLRRLRGRRKPQRAGISRQSGQYPRRAASIGHPLKRWCWVTVAMLDLIWVYAIQVRVWRALERPVVCDRHLLDSQVDFRVNFPDDRVEDRLLWRLLCRVTSKPDAAFCLLIPAEQSLRRTQNRGRLNWETPGVVEQRLLAYRTLADELPVRILDGEQPIEQIASILRDRVAELTGSSAVEPDSSRRVV